MYKSPIEIIQHRANYDSSKHLDEGIFTAIVRADIHVERDELIKALQYDRDQYQKGFEDGKSLNKWISVKDRLPEEKQSVLVHYVDGWMPIAFLLNGKWYQSGGETSWLSVTHWMPLPEAPKEE